MQRTERFGHYGRLLRCSYTAIRPSEPYGKSGEKAWKGAYNHYQDIYVTSDSFYGELASTWPAQRKAVIEDPHNRPHS